MLTLIYVVFTFVCIFLIVTVLLQPGKSGGLGAAFGGGSNTVFGASGGTPVFRRMTTGAAVCFMLLSLLLAYKSLDQSVTSQTVAVRHGLDFSDTEDIPSNAPALGTLPNAAPVESAPVVPAAPVEAAPVVPAAPVEAAPVVPAAPVEAAPVVPAAPVESAPIVPAA